MKQVVFLAWKDIEHPHAGGAERVHQELSRHLAADGFAVTHLVPGFPGAAPMEERDGIRILRHGTGMVSFPGLRRVLRDRKDLADAFLVDVFNCLGSRACLDRPGRSCLFLHHVQGRMWFHQTRFPGLSRGVGPLLSVPGWCAERIALRRLARTFRGPVITVSPSTRRDLLGVGFGTGQVQVLPMASRPPSPGLPPPGEGKAERFTVLTVGTRKSKRPIHVARAFAALAARIPDVHLVVAGRGTEDEAMRTFLRRQGLLEQVTFHGPIREAGLDRLYVAAHAVCLASAKEGWGLVVLEANACATPVVAYDVSGLRDSVTPEAGILTRESPEAMAQALLRLNEEWRDRPDAYAARCRAAATYASQFSFDRTYAAFRAACPALGTGDGPS